MFAAIARFELQSRLRRASTWVYFGVLFALAFLFMNAAGGAFPGATVTFGTRGKALVNGPLALDAFTTLLGQLGLIVGGAIVGRAVYQDFEHDSHALFFTKPISKAAYLGGRFAGALVVVLGIYLSIGLGLWLGSRMPWLDQTRLGPTRFAAYAMPYLTSVIPNLLFSGAIFFAVASLARRILPIYVVSIVFVVGYLASQQLLADVDNRALAALIDPFGMSAARAFTEYWTASERSTRLVPLSGLILVNRAIWLAVAAVVFGYAYRRFAFAHLPSERRRRVPAIADAATAMPAPPSRPLVVTQRWDAGARWAALFDLFRLQLRETVKSIYFVAVLLAGVLFMFATSGTVGKLFGTTTYPVTYAVIEVVQGNFSLFMLILITFFSGELIWRERDARIDQIVDAMPVPGWVPLAAKVWALLAMQVVLMAVVMVCGLLIQLGHGYTHFELWLYVRELFANRLIDFWLLSILAVLVHVLVNSKYMGHFIMILYYVVSLSLPLLGVEHHLIDYDGSPQLTYSDMNGFGHFVQPLVWFRVYWAAFAVALALVAHLFWVRGVERGVVPRARLARARLSRAAQLGFGGALLTFVAVGGFIFYNTNVLNRYRTAREDRREAAAYERQYKQYQKAPLPRVTSVQLAVDIDPPARRAHIRGTLGLVNACTTPIVAVYVTVPPPVRMQKLALGRGETMTLRDDRLGFYALALPKPLAPSETATLEYEVEQAARGFVNDNDRVRVYANGTFFDTDTLLRLGYLEGRELTDDDERRKDGLGPHPGMAKLEDARGRDRSALDGVDWTTFDAVVSTTPDQLAVAPGDLVREWQENGRRYFHYRMTEPTLNFYAALSARYAVVRDHWKDVAIEIDYHPGHEYNLTRMIEGIQKSLDYCTSQFGPYQFKRVRILEFPRYARFAESFPNTIPYSESIGFIAKVDAKDEDDVDYPYYVTAHEVAHQWWAHQVIGADVQGAAFLTETMAQYSALMVMKQKYGPARMKRFLKYELDSYLRGRGTERKKERPLSVVESQPYIYYQKGSLAMYALQDAIGEEVVNAALRRFLEKHRFEKQHYARSVDLIEELRAAAPPQYRPMVSDLFEKIVLWENRAESATVSRLPDGRWQVRVKVHAKKLEADEIGREKELPLDDWIDVGVLDKNDAPLAMEKRHITRPQEEMTFVVAGEPARAGIDPWVHLIDRRWSDNTISVSR